MQFSSIRRLWALIITKLLQHLTKLCGDANSRNKVCNQFQFSSLEFVQYTCNSWIYSFKNFFMYVNVFPYVTLTNFHHAALSVNKELMKGTTLTLNQLAATWGYSNFTSKFYITLLMTQTWCSTKDSLAWINSY